MKVFIDTDEWYPVFSIIDIGYDTDAVEITEDEFNFIIKTAIDFQKAQNILHDAYDKSKGLF